MQVSSKIGVIESLIEKVDKIILGGGMIFTFFKARGLGVGSSLVEEEQLDLAKRLEQQAKDKGEDMLWALGFPSMKHMLDAASSCVDS